MAQRFEVIVVGLGPAGAAAAITLARAGAKVLALHHGAGKTKPCGGCLSAKAMAELQRYHPPAWVRQYPADRLWLAAPGRPAGLFATSVPGAYYLDRGRLDRWLAQAAAEAGAWVVQTRARQVQAVAGGFQVSGRDRSWQGDWLLGADGAGGLVGRRLGLGGSAFCYQALVQERPASPAEISLLRGSALLELGAARRGYAWAFLRGQRLNLGVAGRGLGGGRLAQCYGRFLARHGLGRPGPWQGAVIPCPDGRARRRWQGRAAVLGDAAGLADPFLGEGVGPALVSGRLAARAVLAGDLAGYGAALKLGLLREFFFSRQLTRAVYGAPGVFQSLAWRHPGAVELGWQVLRGQLSYQRLGLAVARGLGTVGRRLISSGGKDIVST